MATRTPVTPLYAIAGAGDLAVEKFRAVSDDVTTRFAKLDQKALQSTLQTELTKRQVELSKRLEALAADAKTVPAKLRELPAVAQAGLTTVLGQAEETYDDLAARGEEIVEPDPQPEGHRGPGRPGQDHGEQGQGDPDHREEDR